MKAPSANIQAPEKLQAPKCNVVPPMTDPMGKYWHQPAIEEILIDDTHALMTVQTLERLADYSHSQPTGVYPGKMWRSKMKHPTRPHEAQWWLCWFGEHPDPTICTNNYRRILVVDLPPPPLTYEI